MAKRDNTTEVLEISSPTAPRQHKNDQNSTEPKTYTLSNVPPTSMRVKSKHGSIRDSNAGPLAILACNQVAVHHSRLRVLPKRESYH